MKISHGHIAIAVLALMAFVFSQKAPPSPPVSNQAPSRAVEAPTPVANPVAIAPPFVATPTPLPIVVPVPIKAPIIKPVEKTIYISGSHVALRASPDAKASILDRLNNGQSVIEIERKNGWVKVRHSLTQIDGYVAVSRLRDTPPEGKEKEEVKAPTKADTAIVLTVSAIAALLIAESVADYRSTRPCACPYNQTRTGASCGGRSAWSRPGGAKPLCYPTDITSAMISAFRQQAR
jgi:hypothetical protein